MTTTTVTHAYALPLDPHVKMLIGATLREKGPIEAWRLAERLQWNIETVEEYWNQPPLPRFHGVPVFTWELTDFNGLTIEQARFIAEWYIVSAFDSISSADVVGDHLAKPEYEIRRIRKRAQKIMEAGWNRFGRARMGNVSVQDEDVDITEETGA